MTATATPRAAVEVPTGPFASIRRVRPVHVVAAETVLAAALMSYNLGRQSLWFDEAATSASVQLSVKGALRLAVEGDPTTGLYLVLIRLWGALFGDSEVALRSLSVVAGVALVPVMYALTARLFGTRTALVAGLLTAVSTTVVAEAQQARHYALMLLLVTLATLCFVRAVEVDSPGTWLLYALVAVVAIYVHPFAAFVVAAHAVSLVALPPSEIPWRRVLLTAGGLTLAVIPLVVAVVRRHGSGGLYWIGPTTWKDAEETFEMLAGGTVYLLLASLVASAFAFRATLRAWARSGRGIEAWRYTLPFIWLLTPVAAITLISVVRPLFVDRYMIGALPALLIIVSVGITAMKPSQLATGFLIALVVLNGVVLVNWLGSDTESAQTAVPREDWRGAVAYVVAHAGDDDAIVVQPRHLETAWNYYSRQHGPPREAPPLTLEFAPHEEIIGGRQAQRISADHDRVWLVIAHLDDHDVRQVMAKFDARYRLTATRQFTGEIDVLRYDA